MSSDWDFISKNKPTVVRQFDMSLELSVGYIEGDRWITVDEYCNMSATTPIPWNSARISVVVDDQTIFDDYTQSHMSMNASFDDGVSANHNFKLLIDGITDEHKPYLPGSSIEGGFTVRLVKITIDTVSILSVVNSIGSYVLSDQSTLVPSGFFGSNGCLTFDFSTPIYSWLHRHRDAVKSDLYCSPI
jgi:hypothetical protein